MLSTGPPIADYTATCHHLRCSLYRFMTKGIELSRYIYRKSLPTERYRVLVWLDSEVHTLKCAPTTRGKPAEEVIAEASSQANASIANELDIELKSLSGLLTGATAVALEPTIDSSYHVFAVTYTDSADRKRSTLFVADTHVDLDDAVQTLSFLVRGTMWSRLLMKVWGEMDETATFVERMKKSVNDADREEARISLPELQGKLKHLGFQVRPDVVEQCFRYVMKVARPEAGEARGRVDPFSDPVIDSGQFESIMRDLFFASYAHLYAPYFYPLVTKTTTVDEGDLMPPPPPANWLLRMVKDCLPYGGHEALQANRVQTFLERVQRESVTSSNRLVDPILLTSSFLGDDQLSFSDFARMITSPDANNWQQPYYQATGIIVHDMTQPLHHYYVACSECPPSPLHAASAVEQGCRGIELVVTDGVSETGVPTPMVVPSGSRTRSGETPDLMPIGEWLDALRPSFLFDYDPDPHSPCDLAPPTKPPYESKPTRQMPFFIFITPMHPFSEVCAVKLRDALAAMYRWRLFKWKELDDQHQRERTWSPVLLKGRVLIAYKTVKDEIPFMLPIPGPEDENAPVVDERSDLYQLAVLTTRFPDTYPPAEKGCKGETDCSWIAPVCRPLLKNSALEISRWLSPKMFLRYVHDEDDRSDDDVAPSTVAVKKRITRDRNPSFLRAWGNGVQFVFIDYTGGIVSSGDVLGEDPATVLQHYNARLACNGRCGYLLKSRALRGKLTDAERASRQDSFKLGQGRRYRISFRLTICVVSVHQLPALQPDQEYHITIQATGHPEDAVPSDSFWESKVVCATEKDAEYSTLVFREPEALRRMVNLDADVADDKKRKEQDKTDELIGLDNRCQARFEFRHGELAVITVRLLIGDKVLSESMCPLSVLRPGVRAIPLKDISTGKVIPKAALVCHFNLEQVTTQVSM